MRSIEGPTHQLNPCDENVRVSARLKICGGGIVVFNYRLLPCVVTLDMSWSHDVRNMRLSPHLCFWVGRPVSFYGFISRADGVCFLSKRCLGVSKQVSVEYLVVLVYGDEEEREGGTRRIMITS